MSLNAVQRIAEAEETARKLKAEAQAEARKLAENAENECRLAVETARRQAEDEILSIRRELEQKAAEKSKQLMTTTLNRCAAIRAHAEKRRESAAQFIVGAVVGE